MQNFIRWNAGNEGSVNTFHLELRVSEFVSQISVVRHQQQAFGPFIQATDSHTCMGGSVGALAYGVGATEYAALEKLMKVINIKLQ